jgi:hypothetical protein
MSVATRIAVQRAGKSAKLAFVKNDEAFKNLAVGEALDVTEELVMYHEDCRTIINKMVALNGNMPSKDRTRIVAAQSALLKELRIIHGESFDYVGGYFNNPVEFEMDGDEPKIDENGNTTPTKWEPIYAIQRTK